MSSKSSGGPAANLTSSRAQHAVSQLLRQLVDDGKEIGIQVAAYLGEECVVNAHAGRVAPPQQSAVVTDQTLFPVFSVAKAVVSLAAHRQVEKGCLDLDAPMATCWPEFAAHGKDRITLRDVLTHRSGVPQMPAGMSIERMSDWQWMTAAIAALAPCHEPGKRSFYHAMTYGWLIGEVVRRTDPGRRPFDQFVQEEILRPLNIDGFFLRVAGATRPRVATLSGAGYAPPPDDSPMRLGMPQAVDLTPEVFNRADVQQALVPAVGAYANAASVARLFAVLANLGALEGVRLLSEASVKALMPLRPDPDETDMFLGGPARLSNGGYWLGGKKPAVGSRANILYSLGTGGSLAWADCDHRLAVAITHNRMYPGQSPETDPAVAIGRCIRESIGIPD